MGLGPLAGRASIDRPESVIPEGNDRRASCVRGQRRSGSARSVRFPSVFCMSHGWNSAWFKPFGARVTLFLMYGRAVLATKDVRAKASGQVAEGFTPPSVTRV